MAQRRATKPCAGGGDKRPSLEKKKNHHSEKEKQVIAQSETDGREKLSSETSAKGEKRKSHEFRRKVKRNLVPPDPREG